MKEEDWLKEQLERRDLETNNFLVQLLDGRYGKVPPEAVNELGHLLGPLEKQPPPEVNLLLGHMQNLYDAYNGGHGDVEAAFHDIFKDWENQGWVK